MERDEGDLDLRRERRGGRAGGGGGGDGEGGVGLEDVFLLGILKPPPPLSLPLHRSLSLPEEEQAAVKRQTIKETGGGDKRNHKTLTTTAKHPHAKNTQRKHEISPKCSTFVGESLQEIKESNQIKKRKTQTIN